MDKDLLVRHRMVQIQGPEQVLAAERVLERLLEGLGPVGGRRGDHRYDTDGIGIGMDDHEEVEFLKDFYAGLLSVHMLGIQGSGLTE